MQILKENFKNLTEKEREYYKSFFEGFRYTASGYTFLANDIWKTGYGMWLEEIEGYLFIGSENPHIKKPHAFFSMPLARDGRYEKDTLRKAVLEVKGRCERAGIPLYLGIVPENMKEYLDEAFPGEIEWKFSIDDSEYVYEKDKLIALSGRALHKKKNHMNYFYKTFDYTSKKITTDMQVEVMDFVVRMRKEKEKEDGKDDGLLLEEKAIEEMLKHVEEENVYSWAVYVDGSLEAFALGQRLNDDTCSENFEKANTRFRGLYQAICSEFCKTLPEDVVYVNREEDMGLENLRKAKQALKPHHMEHKYSCCFL